MIQYAIPFLLLGAAAFLGTGKKLQGLETAIAAVRYRTASITKITFSVDLEVYNPNKSGAITINEIDLKLIYRGNTIATLVKRDLTLPIKALSKAKINNLNVDISLLQAINEALSALLKDYEKTIIVKGVLKADGLTYPIEDTIELTKA